MIKDYIINFVKKVPIKATQEEIIEFLPIFQSAFDSLEDNNKKEILSDLLVKNKNFYNIFIEKNKLFANNEENIKRVQKSIIKIGKKEIINYDFNSFTVEDKCAILRSNNVLGSLNDIFLYNKEDNQLIKKITDSFFNLEINNETKLFFSNYIEKEIGKILYGVLNIKNNIVFKLLKEKDSIEITDKSILDLAKKPKDVSDCLIFLIEPFFSKHKELLEKDSSYQKAIVDMVNGLINKASSFYINNKPEYLHAILKTSEWNSCKDRYLELIDFFDVNKNVFLFDKEKYLDKISNEFLFKKEKENLISSYDFFKSRLLDNSRELYGESCKVYLEDLLKNVNLFKKDASINKVLAGKYIGSGFELFDYLMFKIAVEQEDAENIKSLLVMRKLEKYHQHSSFNEEEYKKGLTCFIKNLKNIEKDFYINPIIEDSLLKIKAEDYQDLLLALDYDSFMLLNTLVNDEGFVFGHGKEEKFSDTKEKFNEISKDVFNVFTMKKALMEKNDKKQIKI